MQPLLGVNYYEQSGNVDDSFRSVSLAILHHNYFINQESEKECSLGHPVHHWSCTAFIFSHRSCEKRLYGRKYRTGPCLYVYLVIQRSSFYHWHHSFSEKEKE